jgi:hypothetical protein
MRTFLPINKVVTCVTIKIHHLPIETVRFSMTASLSRHGGRVGCMGNLTVYGNPRGHGNPAVYLSLNLPATGIVWAAWAI